jgi:hypothetical protein
MSFNSILYPSSAVLKILVENITTLIGDDFLNCGLLYNLNVSDEFLENLKRIGFCLRNRTNLKEVN